jgi:beta-galactosidase
LQQPVWNLIGAKIEDNDQLPPGRKASVKAFSQNFKWNIWGELLSEYQGTEVIARYDDQYYAGTPAAVTRKTGKGTITYVGVWTEKGGLEKQILRSIYQRAGANILDLPNYAFVEWRDGFWIGVNYTSDNVTLPVPEKAKMIFGDKIIKPGEVAVWME